MSDLEEIRRRLSELDAIESIKQLKARYFRFVDEKKHDDLVALFTPDPKLVTDGIVWKSPQEFAYSIRDLTGDAPSVDHGHMPEIEITGPTRHGDLSDGGSADLPGRKRRPGEAQRLRPVPGDLQQG
ncbi:nuclear transport factor 2 family protein [Streptomyces flaveolus]|uniref:nuclear transport factor 2 family protein n=1 Tax=Streptomyces flaveolus TaxID=67297 RepID=UPI0033DBAC26